MIALHVVDDEVVGFAIRSQQRLDQRNGYYERDLVTSHGTLEDVRVPRSRNGVYEPEVFDRYQRRSAEVDEAIVGMFCRGVSTRQVGDILEVLKPDGSLSTLTMPDPLTDSKGESLEFANNSQFILITETLPEYTILRRIK